MQLDVGDRYENPQEALQQALDGHKAGTWTSFPGIIQSFNAATITCEVQPAIKELYTGANLGQKFVQLPQMPDVPVLFLHGGGYSMTFPIQVGDEALVFISCRCIDTWWDQGGIQNQREIRMHDLSDGFALVGPWSQKTKINNIAIKTSQWRSDDGTIFVELDKPNNLVRVLAGGLSFIVDAKNNKIDMTAATVTVHGDLHSTGAVIAGFGSADQVGLQTHTTPNISTGIATSGPPKPGS